MQYRKQLIYMEEETLYVVQLVQRLGRRRRSAESSWFRGRRREEKTLYRVQLVQKKEEPLYRVQLIKRAEKKTYVVQLIQKAWEEMLQSATGVEGLEGGGDVVQYATGEVVLMHWLDSSHLFEITFKTFPGLF